MVVAGCWGLAEGFWVAVESFMEPREAFCGPVAFDWRVTVQREERGAVIIGTVSLEGVGGKMGGALADDAAVEETVDEDEQGVGGE